MPQLDIVSFCTQISWVVLLFGIFYYIIVNIILRRIYKTIKIRGDLRKFFEKKGVLLIKEEKVLQRIVKGKLEDVKNIFDLNLIKSYIDIAENRFFFKKQENLVKLYSYIYRKK